MEQAHRGRRWLRWALGFALVAVVVAVAGVVWKTTVDKSSAETQPQPADTARGVRDGLARRRLRARCTSCSRPHSHRPITFAAFKQALPAGRRRSRLSSRSRRSAPPGCAVEVATVPVVANTREFGHVHQTLSLRLVTAPAGFRVLWGPQLVFPGLKPGEHAASAHPRALRPRRHSRPRRGDSGERPGLQPRVSQGAGVLGCDRLRQDPRPTRWPPGWPRAGPRAGRTARRGSSSRSTECWRPARDRSAGGVATAGPARCWASAPAPSREDVVTTLRIHAQHDVGRCAGWALRRGGRARSQVGRRGGVGRARDGGAAAAGLVVQDGDRCGGAATRRWRRSTPTIRTLATSS